MKKDNKLVDSPVVDKVSDNYNTRVNRIAFDPLPEHIHLVTANIK